MTFSKKPTVRICVQRECCQNGAKRVYEELKKSCCEEADIQMSEHCFRFCKKGPNMTVDGNVLSCVRPGDAIRRLRAELKHTSRKVDGVGSRSIDELNALLDEMIP